VRARDRELGRGERVLPGLWRLRLPLPWPGVPHGNAWAIAAGDGLVLVDTGIHSEDSMAQLERAMDQMGLRIEQVRLLVITHAHFDHWGQAKTIVERAGCDMWVHPAARLALRHLADRDAELRLRLEVGRQSGVSQEALDAYAQAQAGRDLPFAGPVRAARDLVTGVTVDTDLGQWKTYETPGHAPSHVCLYQPEHRLLISGDHLLGRIVLWFEYGDSSDPIAEYLSSLDVVAGLRARLALSGHGKPFLDVPGHIEGSRRAVHAQLRNALAALSEGARTATEITPQVLGDERAGGNPAWLLPLTLCVLEHLERRGEVVRERDGEIERWRAVAGAAASIAAQP
jgi:glyoxylase-like metal-dependent hydrolase (beta-lactamase superfamily II)